MTTQTTTIQPGTTNARAFIGAAAAGLALLGGVLLWQVRPASETTPPAPSVTVGTSGEGVAPLGGLAEQYRDEQQAAAGAAARVTTMGGMAERYAEQRASVAAPEPVTTRGGLAERYAEEQAAARAEVARRERMGGMAELYRDQAATASGAW